MADHRKDRFMSLPVLALIVAGLLMLYVLSSGPSRSLASRWDIMHYSRAGEPGRMEIEIKCDVWWETLYAPLNWVDRQPWGTPLAWYWSLFPLPEFPS